MAIIMLFVGVAIGVVAMGLIRFGAYQAALSENEELRRQVELLGGELE